MKSLLYIFIGLLVAVIVAVSVYYIFFNNSTPAPPKEPFKVGGYIGNWTVWRTGDGQYPQKWKWGDPVTFTLPSGLDEIVYSFLLFDTAGNLKWSVDPDKIDLSWDDDDNFDFDLKALDAFKALPAKNKLISLGGYTFSVDHPQMWETISGDESLATTLAQNVLENIVKPYGFTGVDIDWEYPNTAENKKKFVTMIKAFSAVFKPENISLTAAIAINPDVINEAYDFKTLNDYIDWYHIMSYDISGNFGSPAGDNIFGANTDMDYISNTVDLLLKSVPPEKLYLGLATYGRGTHFTAAQLPKGVDDIPLGKTFTPISADCAGGEATGVCYTGYIPDCYCGPYTKTIGYLSGYEIFDLLQDENKLDIVSAPSDSADTIYAVLQKPGVNDGFEYLAISFDGIASIQNKTKYAMDKGLKGVFVWQIGDDDFRNGFPLTGTALAVRDGTGLPTISSSRKQYSVAECGLPWQSTNIQPISYYGADTCAPNLPDTCQLGGENQEMQQGEGMAPFIGRICGDTVLYQGAPDAPYFYANYLQDKRLQYCTDDGMAVFNPDCGSASDTGACIANALPTSIKSGRLCLRDSCDDLTC